MDKRECAIGTQINKVLHQTLPKVLIFRDGISYDILKFSISNVYSHVGQLNDFFLSSVSQTWTIAQQDIDNLQNDPDHEDDHVIQIKVGNND